VDQPVGAFQLLVGANATGKTTFVDVVSFLGDLVSSGVEKALRQRSVNFRDMLWKRIGESFELAIELALPESVTQRMEDPGYSLIRYEVAIDADVGGQGVGLSAEKVWLIRKEQGAPTESSLFPEALPEPKTVLLPKRKAKKQQRTVVSKVVGGNDNYTPETAKGYSPSFKQSPKKSALGNLPADEASFPASTWLRTFLTEGIQRFVLNADAMRVASPPNQDKGFKTDGSNLPWVIEGLKQTHPELFGDWVRHVRTALPDVVDLYTIERNDDKHRYLVLEYANGAEVPSWVASDGTLRLLALTLPAYLPEFRGLYLVEEPENGIHPKAAETVYQSLSSVYNSQVFVATHSPVLLSLVKPKDAHRVLCFAKSDDGSTAIVAGDRHPHLKEWQGDPNLAVLFAGGVLG